MGKISDALDKQNEEKDKATMASTMDMVTLIDAKLKPPPPRMSKDDIQDLRWYEEISTRLLTRYAGESIKSIMFASTAHGGGSTTTAINFAKTLVRDKRVKVLLIDANLRTPNFRQIFDITKERGLSDIIFENNHKAFKVLKFGKSFLFVLATGGEYSGPLSLFESERFDAFLSNARNWFDYTIFDAAPLPSFAESRVLCKKVDGVVLVIESGKIRKQVAQRAIKELEDAGARILGVVVNRRKYYIPDWIYKRL
jgi:protein-tyrosine kinase